eukprot:s194_g57.t1
MLWSMVRQHTLVLCERDWGAQEIRKLNVGFKVLSAAEIIDDLLREVRQWARHGFSGREIQARCRRITWLNANVFGYAPLDEETREAAASVPLDRALEILKDLEGKSATVQNPSGYVKASIKRELSGDTRKRPASIMAGPPAKRRA